MEASYKFYQNRACKYFPCHETNDEEHFNCLFCYCPLYALGSGCNGNFRYTEKGVKDCTACLIPHSQGGYDYVIQNYGKIKDLAEKNR